jgi:protease-4
MTARTLGLVDNLGSLKDAIRAAARLAELDTYATEYIRPPVSVKERFLQLFTTAQIYWGNSSIIQHPVVARLKKTLFNHLDDIFLLDDPRGVYAKCLVNLSW